MSYCAQWVIVLLYWIVLYDPDSERGDYQNINAHGLNLVIILIESYISSNLFYKEHFKSLLLMPISYLLFNCIYTLADNPIYDVLTYKDVASYIYVIVGLLLYSLFYLLKFKIYHLS